jgi:hypothetical protein
MGEARTFVGIEIPRVPQRLADGTFTEPGGWRVGGVGLLDRLIGMALAFTTTDHIRLLTGAPDQAVFDAMARYDVQCAVLTEWMGQLAGFAAEAGPEDVAVVLRMQELCTDSAALASAIEGCRGLAEVDSVVPAVGERGDDAAELAPCGAFEVTKVRCFAAGGFSQAAARRVERVVVAPEHWNPLRTRADWVRAEAMLAHPRGS